MGVRQRSRLRGDRDGGRHWGPSLWARRWAMLANCGMNHILLVGAILRGWMVYDTAPQGGRAATLFLLVPLAGR